MLWLVEISLPSHSCLSTDRNSEAHICISHRRFPTMGTDIITGPRLSQTGQKATAFYWHSSLVPLCTYYSKDDPISLVCVCVCVSGWLRQHISFLVNITIKGIHLLHFANHLSAVGQSLFLQRRLLPKVLRILRRYVSRAKLSGPTWLSGDTRQSFLSAPLRSLRRGS